MFLLGQLLLSLWKAISSLLGWKKSSSKNLAKTKKTSKRSSENVKASNRSCTVYKHDERKAKTSLGNKEESKSKGCARTTSFLELHCADDSSMKSARSCVSNSEEQSEVEYEIALACPEDTQHKKVTIDAKVLEPYTTDQNTSREFSPPTRKESNPNSNNDCELSELDAYYNSCRARRMTFLKYPDCCCHPNPCVCNYPNKSSCWGSDYYPRYNRNLDMDFNVGKYFQSRYDVDGNLRPNFLSNYYQSKSRHEINREGSVEFLYPKTDNICADNFSRSPRLRTSLSKQNHLFEPRYYSTWNETQRVPSRSPLKYTCTPERTQYNEHYTNDWNQHGTSPDQYTNDQNTSIPLSPRYSPERSRYNEPTNDHTRLIDNTTIKQIPKYGDERMNENVYTKETIKSYKQTGIDDIEKVVGIPKTQAKTINAIPKTNGATFSITTNKAKPEKQELQNKNNQTKMNDTSNVRQSIKTNTTPQEGTSSGSSQIHIDKTGATEKELKIVDHQAHPNDSHQRDKENADSTEVRNQEEKGKVRRKLLLIHNQKRCESREKAKMHRSVCMKDPKTNQLQSRPTQTNATYPQIRNFLGLSQEYQRQIANQKLRTEPDSSGITSSDESKVVTYNVGTTGKLCYLEDVFLVYLKHCVDLRN